MHLTVEVVREFMKREYATTQIIENVPLDTCDIVLHFHNCTRDERTAIEDIVHALLKNRPIEK